MSNKKSFKLKPLYLLIAAAILLAASTVGSTQAALTYYSENYSAEVTVSNIGVTLLENETQVSRRNYIENDRWDEVTGKLLTNMLAEGEDLVLGKTYKEELSVENSGTIDTYVRVTVRKSWQNADGIKDTKLSPELIDLNFLTGNGWVMDESASTAERTVLYYTDILASGAATPAFTDTLRIDPSIATKVVETVDSEIVNGKEYKNITYVYEYDGYTFNIEAEVDAVQTHNAEDAIKSAWGVDVTVSTDGSLSLQ